MMKRYAEVVPVRRFSFALLMGATLLSACPPSESKETKEGKEAPQNADPAAAVDPTQAAPKEKIDKLPPGEGPVALVNGVAIPRTEFNREFSQTMERYERARHTVRPELRERLIDNIVRRLVDAEVIRQQAEKLEIKVPEETFSAEWEKHRGRYGTEDAFKAFLERAGTTEELLKSQFRHNMLRERVFAHVGQKVSLGKNVVKDYYTQNKARYAQPEQIRVSHILIRVPQAANSEEKQARRARAEAALKELKKDKKKFADVAKKYGEDPSKAKGGDLGYLSQGRMPQAFEAVAWKLKKGQISEVVESPFGFHIIKKTDQRKARKQSFAEAKEQIERSLMARERNLAIRTALNNWRSESKIEIKLRGDPKIINRPATPKLTNLKDALNVQEDKPNTPEIKQPNLAKPATE